VTLMQRAGPSRSYVSVVVSEFVAAGAMRQRDISSQDAVHIPLCVKPEVLALFLRVICLLLLQSVCGFTRPATGCGASLCVWSCVGGPWL
jgi:hypothetical protein